MIRESETLFGKVELLAAYSDIRCDTDFLILNKLLLENKNEQKNTVACRRNGDIYEPCRVGARGDY